MFLKPARAFIVVAVCNFDDVLVGHYLGNAHGYKLAIARARNVARNPALRFRAKQQANDTEFLFSRVYAVTGSTRFKQVGEFAPEVSDGEEEEKM
jgi:hypothetical protein